MTPEIPDIAPLDPRERARALDAIASRVHRYRLETPAAMLLEASRPFAGLAGMASFVVSPLFGAFLGLDRVERYSTLLADRSAFDELIERLECYRVAPQAASADPDAGAGNENDAETGSNT